MRIDLEQTKELVKIKGYHLCFGNKNIIELLIKKEYKRIIDNEIKKRNYHYGDSYEYRKILVKYIKDEYNNKGVSATEIGNTLGVSRFIIVGFIQQGLSYSISVTQIENIYKTYKSL